MSAEDDALREMAVNRGCKLVKSRVRTPGRGDYGRYGLKDARTGKAVLGIGRKGLTATGEEIAAFLRGDALQSWKASVGKTPKAKRERSTPPAPPEPAPQPAKLVLREAVPKDANALASLIGALGYDVTAADLRRRIAALARAGEPALVAERGEVVGCLTWHVTPVLHRPQPVGRITMLVVAEAARGEGIGTALVAAAEARLRRRKAGLVEVTSNIKRLRAHAFYQRLGFDRTSYRFARAL